MQRTSLAAVLLFSRAIVATSNGPIADMNAEKGFLLPNAPSNKAQQDLYDFSWAPNVWNADGSASGVPGVPAWTAWFKSNPIPPATPDQVDRCLVGDTAVWGASFDDGPGYGTQTVLDWFLQHGLKTTFFTIGANVVNNADLVNATFNAGHLVASHTYSHPYLTHLSDDQVIAELVYSVRAIKEVTGKIPVFFRPPYGDVDDRVRQLAGMMGLRSVIWNEDSGDWTHIGSSDMAQVPSLFQSWVDEGVTQAVSLEHDFWSDTAAAGTQAMDVLAHNGRHVVPMDECIGISDPYDNRILDGFFTSGQFDNHDKVVPFRLGTAKTTATETATMTVTATTLATVEAVFISSSANISSGDAGAVLIDAYPSLSNGQVAAIAACAALFVIIAVLAAVLVINQRRKKRAEKLKLEGSNETLCIESTFITTA